MPAEFRKCCWWCKHFRYENAGAYYSEDTPGYSFNIGCMAAKWEFNPEYTTREEFAEILETAETCTSFVRLI